MPNPANFIEFKEFVLCFNTALSPYEIFLYDKRVAFPSFSSLINIGAFHRVDLLLKGGIYPKNETEKYALFFGFGVRYALIKKDFYDYLALALVYNQLRNLKFLPYDPNLTVHYKQLTDITGSIEFAKQVSGLTAKLSVGLQHVIIDGKFWQEVEPDYIPTDYSAGTQYLSFTASLYKTFTHVGFGVDLFMSGNKPGFGIGVFLKP